MAGNHPVASDDETEILQFSLTNPEQLSHQLENAHLNDEETDVLLKEALKLNEQLKDALRSQQFGEDEHYKSRKSKHPYGPSAPLAPRNPRQSNLPPIPAKKDLSLVGSGRKEPKSKASLDIHRGGSASKRKGSAKKAPSRPAWDDRFNYS